MPFRATLLTLTLLATASVNANDWQRQGVVEGNLPASAAVESADDVSGLVALWKLSSFRSMARARPHAASAIPANADISKPVHPTNADERRSGHLSRRETGI